jgi:uncharacterized lipoprotein YmbA
MNHYFPATKMLASLLAAAVLAGCASSPPARFYRLSPQAQESTQKAPNQVSVSIAPVIVPDYLDRPQIVTLDGQNTLKYAEFDRWAGSLPDDICLVVAENLSQLLGSERVYAYPRISSGKTDYTVSLRIVRLDCYPAREAVLKAQWTVSSGQEIKDLVTHTAAYREPLNDVRYDTLAAAVSRMIALLSGDIARDIAPPK